MIWRRRQERQTSHKRVFHIKLWNIWKTVKTKKSWDNIWGLEWTLKSLEKNMKELQNWKTYRNIWQPLMTCCILWQLSMTCTDLWQLEIKLQHFIRNLDNFEKKSDLVRSWMKLQEVGGTYNILHHLVIFCKTLYEFIWSLKNM